MDLDLQQAFVMGYERMAAWSDLLDDINLYPVADADTGRNLRISLAPLKNAGHQNISKRLHTAATGNSGNIAAAFFAEFVTLARPDEISHAAQCGRKAAWQALLDPQPGTMLTVFDAWQQATASVRAPFCPKDVHQVIAQLKAAVLSTSEVLPSLKQAGVVDAGALGMYLLFEGFVHQLIQERPTFANPSELFGGKLVINQDRWKASPETGFCIDTIIETQGDTAHSIRQMEALGDSVVVLPEGQHLKIHFHTDDHAAARKRLAQMGDVVQWHQEKIEATAPKATAHGIPIPGIHVVTDAAGSLPRRTAQQLGITLLDSYVILGDQHVPETLVDSESLYAAMRQGVKATTAQASVFERHQTYQSLLDRFAHTIYLCVGSAYTGIYDTACRWQKQTATHERFSIIDSAAASGRLAMLAMAVTRFAQSQSDPDTVIAYANTTIAQCQELIFIDQLKYLAAGGRISKARSFFGDLLHFKPVITPRAHGVEKVGVVKNRDEQRRFALDYLNQHLSNDQPADILVEYTDNRDWVKEIICGDIKAQYPQAHIMIHPMSLTSGVHMGPGTWAVAYLPGSHGKVD